MKDYELKWLLDLHFEFSKKYGVNPDLMSDWEPDPENFKFPKKLVREASKCNALDFRYHFLYSIQSVKEKAVHYYNDLHIYSEPLKTFSITITPGVTNALYLLFVALKKKKLKKGLATRPIYFSIRETCQDLGIKLDLIDSYSKDNYVANLDQILQKIKSSAYDFLVLTNPVYCAGLQLDPSYIEEIQKVCIERKVLLIMDEAFVMPWGEGAKDYKAYSTSQTIVIRSSVKTLFVNGLKNATLTGPSWLIKDIETISTYVIGGITYPQLRLAECFFSPDQEIAEEIKECYRNNFAFLRHNYCAIQEMLRNYNIAHLVKANSNPYAMIECSNIANNKTTISKVIKKVLTETKCMILPSWRYSFTANNNPFAFRINLARANRNYIDKLVNILEILKSI